MPLNMKVDLSIRQGCESPFVTNGLKQTLYTKRLDAELIDVPNNAIEP